MKNNLFDANRKPLSPTQPREAKSPFKAVVSVPMFPDIRVRIQRKRLGETDPLVLTRKERTEEILRG